MRWTDHPHFMGDVWNVHDLWLMYSTYVSNRSHMEHSRFAAGVQGTPALQKMVRTSKQQSTDNNYLSAIGLNFPTPSPTT